MKKITSLFKWFGKALNTTRLIVLNTLFFALIIVFIVALSSDDETIVTLKDNSTLSLDFNGVIVEQKQPFDFSSAFTSELTGNEKNVTEYQIDNVLQVINSATGNPKITEIMLDLKGLQAASINHISEIGKALDHFKAAGKKITATSESYTQGQYLLASHADKIYLDPQGVVLLKGYAVYRLYYKELLDNLLITPHIFKVGTFKSYVEPYTQSHMSDASRLANSHWLNQLWDDYINTVLTQRSEHPALNRASISPTLAQLKVAVKNAKGNSAQYAINVGLVDQLSSRKAVLKDREIISFADYQSTLDPLYLSNESEKDHIALIHGTGEILAGTQTAEAIGGDSFSDLLVNALEDEKVKVVVIRIDSPGGSAFASEKIRQQVLALKAAGKKVVVSMGSVAASGGYWIASAADYIYTTPTTLTGSIGIFGMFASAEKALNKIGIYNDGIATTEFAGVSPTRALDPDIKEILQMGIKSGYQQFLSVVAEGRKMSIGDVDKIAQGRVWTGNDAVKNGLVDEIGNLQDAIAKAAELAKLKSYQVVEIKETISERQQLINHLLEDSVKFIPETITISPQLLTAFDLINTQTTLTTRFNDPKGQYSYCAMCEVK